MDIKIINEDSEFGRLVYIPTANVKIINKSTNPLPIYETDGSAGMDIRSNEDIVLEPGCRAIIHTGLFIEVPVGYQMEVRPRSGLAAKHGIMVTNSPGTIDSDYRGECNVLLSNTGDKPFVINNGDRVAQFVLMPVIRCNWKEADTLSDTNRGTGGFGSTGV